MNLRTLAVLLPCTALAACSMPAMPPVPSLPKMDFSLLDPGVMTGTAPRTFSATRPYALSDEQTRNLRVAVAAAFPTPVTLGFLKIKSGLSDDGNLAACGLVTARDPAADSETRTYIFRAERPAAAQSFELRRIAGRSRSAQLDIYGECSAMKLM